MQIFYSNLKKKQVNFNTVVMMLVNMLYNVHPRIKEKRTDKNYFGMFSNQIRDKKLYGFFLGQHYSNFLEHHHMTLYRP